MAMHSLMELSLAQAFQRAYTTLADCDGGSSASPSQAEECSRLLSHCQALAERAALFSSNEDKDDLVTAHLKYLLVPYLMAELSNLQPQQSTRPLQRLQQLQEALMMYSQFLQRCGQYGFLSGTCYDAYTAEEQGIAADPSTCRNQKVERYKRSRALKGLLQQMRGRKKAADDECGVEVGVGGWDEEDERHFWTLQLEAAAIRALDARSMIRQEMQLLQHAVKQWEPASNKTSQEQLADSSCGACSRQSDQQRSQLQQQAMDKLAGIAGQLSLSGNRQAIRQQVFRPSHILPTLTVEQQGEIELSEARQREAQQQQADAARAAARAELCSDDEDEQELARQRAQDDFKDDNPRGWGNSKLRPCA